MLRWATCVDKLVRMYFPGFAAEVVERAPMYTFTTRILFSVSPAGAGTAGTENWLTGAGDVPSAKLKANCRFSTVSATGCGVLKFTARINIGWAESVVASRKYVIIQILVAEVG